MCSRCCIVNVKLEIEMPELLKNQPLGRIALLHHGPILFVLFKYCLAASIIFGAISYPVKEERE